MSDNAPVAFDMYGQPIYPLGETGFGVSISWHSERSDRPAIYPFFTIFHQSDDYRQSLFSATMDLKGPHISNSFPDRITEHFKHGGSLLGAPSLREDQL